MLEIVGHPFAVNPDKELRQKATANGWPVLVFSKPGRAARPSAPSGRRIAALGAATAVAVGGIIYVGAKRRLGRFVNPCLEPGL